MRQVKNGFNGAMKECSKYGRKRKGQSPEKVGHRGGTQRNEC